MKNNKKAFTIVLVPHSKAGSRTFTCSKKTLKIIAGLTAACVLLLTGFLVDYFLMRGTRAKYKKLTTESIVQRDTLKQYETAMAELKQKVENYDQYAKKLNVMAGLKAPGVKEVGIGDGSAPEAQAAPQMLTPPQFSVESIKTISQKAGDLDKNLSTLVIHFENQKARLATTPTIWPTIGWTTSYFGMRIDPFTDKPQFHYGLDIATNQGNPIVAPADGIIVQLKNERMTGRSILISHGMDVTTSYFHLDRFLVREGQRIKRGDVIGLVGRTGKALGPHLHYEVKINGKPVNPLNYILEE